MYLRRIKNQPQLTHEGSAKRKATEGYAEGVAEGYAEGYARRETVLNDRP